MGRRKRASFLKLIWPQNLSWSHPLTTVILPSWKMSPQTTTLVDFWWKSLLTVLSGIPQATVGACPCLRTFLSVWAPAWATSPNQSLWWSVQFMWCGYHPSPHSVSGPHGSYLRLRSAAITCLPKLCQLCSWLSLPAVTIRGLSKRQELNLDRACHYQGHLRVSCCWLKILVLIMW